jgi:hypothetical protein
MADQSKKDADLKRAQRAEDGRKAMAEYEAEAVAVRAKTERLRALRLARDAALPPAPPKPARKPAKAPKASARSSTAKLSEWLDQQEKSGRKS